jgi:nucleoside-triphosphatase
LWLAGIWLVTGPPGAGKSTVVSRVVLKLKSAGVVVGGCSTSEVRSRGTRVGFEVTDLTTGRKGELASVGPRVGPKVGRYRVNLDDLAAVGAAGLEAAASGSEVIVIDEVGPMELVSPEFRRGVRRCIGSGKPVLAVVHERLEDDLISELKSRAESTTVVTPDNRDAAVDELSGALIRAAGGPKV